MRKILILFMALAMIMTLTACATDGKITVCPNCESTVDNGAKFCSNCGAEIIIVEESDTEGKGEKKPAVLWDGTVADSYESGDGSIENPYEIANGSQLALLAQETNAGRVYSGQYFSLSNNILLNNPEDVAPYYDDEEVCITGIPLNQWTPIGTEEHPFSANFSGGNYTIYGLVITDDWDYAGLFGYVTNAKIEKVHMEAEFICSHKGVGGIAAHVETANGGSASITSCSVNGKLWSIGGLGSYNEYNRPRHLGGIVGDVTFEEGSISIEKCINYAHVLAYVPSSSYWEEKVRPFLNDNTTYYYPGCVGGIVGADYYDDFDNIQYSSYLKKCVNYGFVERRSGSQTGGIAGYIYYRYDSDGAIFVDNCVNMAPIKGGDSGDYKFFGAITGYTSGKINMENCWFVPEYCDKAYEGSGEYIDIKATTANNMESLEWLVQNIGLEKNEWTMVDGKLMHKAAVQKKMD